MRRIDYKTEKFKFHENCCCPACRYNDEILLYVADAVAYETRKAMKLYDPAQIYATVYVNLKERW